MVDRPPQPFCDAARALLAWISTDRNWPNTGARGSMLDESEGIVVPPGDGNRFVEDSGGEDDGQMGAAMEAHPDFAIGDGDVCRHVDEVAEDHAGFGTFLPAHPPVHHPAE